MNLILQREKPTHTALPGMLYESTGKVCFTLERHPDDPVHPPIPAGVYPVTLYSSPKFDTLVPLLHNVPGREMIEIHYGNFPRDTEGCILVGKERDQDAVRYSRLALKELVEKMALDNGPHMITVVESTQEIQEMGYSWDEEKGYIWDEETWDPDEEEIDPEDEDEVMDEDEAERFTWPERDEEEC